MSKKCSRIETNYSRAWNIFKGKKRFKECIEAMERKGIVHPYNENIMRISFEEGFFASGVKIEIFEA
ncbi:MAG TPA: hypothetical protein VKQ08_11140 [Cyclobacteriaceae bacterium]|nr:hypothetical protein [Cyclobacteriaceae bacterium]